MIITVTPNTAIDHTLQISSFQLNSTIRATDSAWGMAGKAADVSWILGKPGVPSRALGFAAGSHGMRMEEMLRQRGIETEFVWADGDTRLNTVIVIPGEGQSTITSSSLKVGVQHLAEFADRYQKSLQSASCIVMGGSLPAGVPAGFYGAAISQANSHGIPVIFDSSGPALATGLAGSPKLIKPNRAEMSELLGYVPASRQEVCAASAELRRKFGSDVIATLGAEGAVAILGHSSYFVHPPAVEVASAAGAGDGVLAGMALAYLRGEPPEEGLRHGFALAGAIMQTLPTADFRIEDYQELLPQIRVEPLA